MSRSRRFAQVDVFSATPYLGNPVAVVLDAEGLDADDMLRVARWTNLSETTFVLPATVPGADYRLRIFTPGGELPFAGHPTLGSAHAWLESGGTPADGAYVVQECGAGLVQIRRGPGELAFAAPPTRREGALDDDHLELLIRAFGVTRDDVVGHQWVDNGPGWAVLRLRSADAVLALDPDLSLIPDAMVGAVGAYPPGSPHAFELRSFAPAIGIAEDPVCGSMNASVAQWLIRSGEASDAYRVSQGKRLGRAGDIAITADEDGAVWVGGATQTLFQGTALI
ncbi:PhzF family phenazine biosynthesis protein [Microbacterium oryzae]|uniref:PhzF family phenazine biosynthesis protein n=1 Tax=Microbacterium oryzae TaxID=743009 RepID=A0A6I6DW65_9MICO|nr:PhzF family phenazine biosynthesis protein [Microbacterium oryzae]QGU28376.1 PhzF family phenazine biosynthesis protein [Microbacterium oryzae]